MDPKMIVLLIALGTAMLGLIKAAIEIVKASTEPTTSFKKKLALAIVVAMLTAASLAALAVLLFPTEKKIADQGPAPHSAPIVPEVENVKTCKQLDLDTRVPQIPACSAYVYIESAGKCEYPSWVGRSGAKLDDELYVYCNNLSKKYEPM